MAKLVVTIVSWIVCVFCVIFVQWFPKVAVLVPLSFVPFIMFCWAGWKHKRGDIKLKNTPEIFICLAVLGVIAAAAIFVDCMSVLGDGYSGEIIDGVYYLTRKGNVIRQITQEEYRIHMRANARWFFGLGIGEGAMAMAFWSADYWWYGPSIVNMQVREFFKLHK